jgi:hypothetical protein
VNLNETWLCHQPAALCWKIFSQSRVGGYIPVILATGDWNRRIRIQCWPWTKSVTLSKI